MAGIAQWLTGPGLFQVVRISDGHRLRSDTLHGESMAHGGTRRLALTLLLLSLLTACSRWTRRVEYPVWPLEVGTLAFPFQWKALQFGAHKALHGSMLVPVRLPGMPTDVHLQLDLGSRRSMLYTAFWERWVADFEGPRVLLVEEDVGRYLPDQSVFLGAARVVVPKLWLRNHRTPRPPSAEEALLPEAVGTLGTDLLGVRALVIDYPGRTLRLLAHLPAVWEARLHWAPMDVRNGRYIVQLQVHGRPRRLIFDTGSSAFALLTTPREWRRLARPGAQVEQLSVPSWDDTLAVLRTASDAGLRVGSLELPIGQVSYIPQLRWGLVLALWWLNVDGLIGNQVFLHDVVVLDPSRGRFGVARAGELSWP